MGQFLPSAVPGNACHRCAAGGVDAPWYGLTNRHQEPLGDPERQRNRTARIARNPDNERSGSSP